jgi:hypothetical protein
MNTYKAKWAPPVNSIDQPNIFGIKKPPNAPMAPLNPIAGDVSTGPNINGIIRNIDPLAIPPKANRIIKVRKNHKKLSLPLFVKKSKPKDPMIMVITDTNVTIAPPNLSTSERRSGLATRIIMTEITSWRSIAPTGVLYFGWIEDNALAPGKNPSLAIAYGIHGKVNTFPFKQPKMETRIPIVSRLPPIFPNRIVAAVLAAYGIIMLVHKLKLKFRIIKVGDYFKVIAIFIRQIYRTPNIATIGVIGYKGTL